MALDHNNVSQGMILGYYITYNQVQCVHNNMIAMLSTCSSLMILLWAVIM